MLLLNAFKFSDLTVQNGMADGLEGCAGRSALPFTYLVSAVKYLNAFHSRKDGGSLC